MRHTCALRPGLAAGHGGEPGRPGDAIPVRTGGGVQQSEDEGLCRSLFQNRIEARPGYQLGIASEQGWHIPADANHHRSAGLRGRLAFGGFRCAVQGSFIQEFNELRLQQVQGA